MMTAGSTAAAADGDINSARMLMSIVTDISKLMVESLPMSDEE